MLKMNEIARTAGVRELTMTELDNVAGADGCKNCPTLGAVTPAGPPGSGYGLSIVVALASGVVEGARTVVKAAT